ncbi:MAG: RsmE family RNA methyltransferase [Oscillospiraceae bacterium]
MAHRYFLDKIDGDTAFILGDEAKHLARVMRIKIGETLILSDKNGHDYIAQTINVDEKQVVSRVISISDNVAEPSCRLTVYMALPKSDKLEFITQKMCELGANRLVPFVSEYCVAQKSKKEDNKKQRLQKISDEACKQSGRNRPMQVQDTLSYKQLIGEFKDYDLVLFFYENSTDKMSALDFNECKNVAIIIGSEGGFSSEEARLALENGAKIIGLGKRILRCETAAITAASLSMFCLGELE